MSALCQRYVSVMSALCQRYVSVMSALCQRYVSVIPALSQRHPSVIPVLSQRYVKRYVSVMSELRTCSQRVLSVIWQCSKEHLMMSLNTWLLSGFRCPHKCSVGLRSGDWGLGSVEVRWLRIGQRWGQVTGDWAALRSGDWGLGSVEVRWLGIGQRWGQVTGNYAALLALLWYSSSSCKALKSF